MKRFLRRWSKGAIVATALGTAAVTGVANALPVAPSGFNSKIDIARQVGSDTTYFQMQAFSNLYNSSPGCKVFSTVADGEDWSECNDDTSGVITTENFDHDEILQSAPFGVGSGNGLKILCGATGGNSTLAAHFSRASRGVKATECVGTPVTQTAFARDGFTFVFWTATQQAYAKNGAGQLTQGPPGRGCLPGQLPPDTTLNGLFGAGLYTKAAGTTQPCTGFYATTGNRRLSDKNIDAIWGHLGATVTDWCQLNNGAIGSGDGNDPLDTNPAYFPKFGDAGVTGACALAPQPIELWDVQTGSGTYDYMKATVLNNIDPNTFAANGVGGPGGPPLQENDAVPIQTADLASSGVLGRSMHWGSWGRFNAAPFSRAGAGFFPVGLAGDVAGDFIAPSTANIGKTSGCTDSTCYLYARPLYNVVKTGDTSGPSLAAKAFIDGTNSWLCRTTSHATNDDTGLNYDVDIGKIYTKFFIARLGGVSNNPGNGPCVVTNISN